MMEQLEEFLRGVKQPCPSTDVVCQSCDVLSRLVMSHVAKDAVFWDKVIKDGALSLLPERKKWQRMANGQCAECYIVFNGRRIHVNFFQMMCSGNTLEGLRPLKPGLNYRLLFTVASPPLSDTELKLEKKKYFCVECLAYTLCQKSVCCGTRYCSRACQVKDWKAGHKSICGVLG